MSLIRVKNIAPILSNKISEDQKMRRQDWAGDLFEVVTIGLEHGPISLENEVDTAFASVELLKESYSAKEEGYHAVVIDCFVDPALDACRGVTELPVIGMGQAALSMAITLGDRIGIVSVLESTIRHIKRNIQKYGYIEKNFSYEIIDIPCRQLWQNFEKTKYELEKKCRGMKERGNCDVIVLGCTSLEPFASELSDMINMPIIMPSYCGLGLAYLMIKMKLKHAISAYPILMERTKTSINFYQATI